MSNLRNWVLPLVLAGTSLGAFAQDDDQTTIDDRWRIHGMVGTTVADDEDYDNGTEFKIGIGKPLSAYFLVEGQINYGELTESAGDDYQRTAGGIDLLYFPFGAFELEASPAQPYFGLGATYHEIDFLGSTQSDMGADAIAGIRYELDTVALRLEARYQVDTIKEDYVNGLQVTENDNFYTYGFLFGVEVPFGEKPKPYNWDSDGDGVPDRLDRCPNTPRGTRVDSTGCPLDSDEDGVPDFRDECPNTPLGAKVNADGCPIDDDRDGVPNNFDQCPNTPFDVPVDSKGCALDTDQDGVPNKIDMCPGTLPGAKVNSRGCVISQTVELKGVHFEFDKTRLMLDSKAILDTVAKSLRNEPDVKIIVAGHTDSMGSDEYNKRLSQGRAQSVVDYLSTHGISLNRLRAVGYGESKPVADNATDEGRERNRRVELELISNAE